MLSKLNLLTCILILTVFLNNLTFSQQEDLPGIEPHPRDLFSLFPDLNWEMSLSESKSVLENLNIKPVNTIPTELAWDGNFNGHNGRASVYFQNDKLNGFTIMLYTQTQTDEVAEEYLIESNNLYGKALSNFETSEYNIITWKQGKDYLIKIQKSLNLKSPLIIVSWIKQTKLY